MLEFIVFLTIFVVVVYHYLKKRDAKKQIDEKYKMEQESRKQRRIEYYDSLPNVYKGVSCVELEHLLKIYEMVEETNKGTQREQMSRDNVLFRGECREEIEKILGYDRCRKYMINGKFGKGPLWYDLDIKYIKKII